MHELLMTKSMLESALKYADNKNAQRIIDLHIQIGELSNMVDTDIQHHWDVITKGTIAEGATLHFNYISAIFQCMACFQKYNPPDVEQFECPNCGAVGVKIITGEEFSVQEIVAE